MSRQDKEAQLAPVDKAFSVCLPLEPLTRPKRSRKLHVGTQMNPAHVTLAADECDCEGIHATYVHVHRGGTSDDGSTHLNNTMGKKKTHNIRTPGQRERGTLKGGACVCAHVQTCVHMHVWVFVPFLMNCINLHRLKEACAFPLFQLAYCCLFVGLQTQTNRSQ